MGILALLNIIAELLRNIAEIVLLWLRERRTGPTPPGRRVNWRRIRNIALSVAAGIAMCAAVIGLAAYFRNYRRFFADVPENHNSYAEIKWAFNHRIAEGVRETDGERRLLFKPDDPATHAHMITFLWRFVDSPKAQSADVPFDAKNHRYQEASSRWATERHLIPGDITYEAYNSYCTRGDAITYLWIIMEEPNYMQSGRAFALKDYYKEAFAWASENGVTKAASFQDFEAYGLCPRNQAVTFLYRARNLRRN